MGKRYASVLDMVRDTTDEEFANTFEQKLEDYSMARELFVLRNRADLTQTQLAQRIGWPQKRVSKIENTPNHKIRFGDFQTCVGALGYDITIQLTPTNMNAVGRIKCAAFEIKAYLDHLAELAQKDGKIHEEVSKFFVEYLVNMIHLFADSTKQLHREGKNPFALLGEIFTRGSAVVQESGKLLPEASVATEARVRVCTTDSDEPEPTSEEGEPVATG